MTYFKFYPRDPLFQATVSFDTTDKAVRWVGLNDDDDVSIEAFVYYSSEYLKDAEELFADAKRYLISAITPPGCDSIQQGNEVVPFKIYGRYEDLDVGAVLFWSDDSGLPLIGLTCGPDIYLWAWRKFSRSHLVPFVQMVEDSLNYLRNGTLPADAVTKEALQSL